MKRQDQVAGVRKKLEEYSYIMSQTIGKGYSSQVYRGKNDLTDQQVAIKVIDMKMIKGEVHKNLLASEVEVLKSLKSLSNIIQVYDIYTTKNNTYIITELCEGGDLAKLISKRKTIPEAQAIQIMTQIINGLTQIQNRAIIHRDLKPANIFINRSQIIIADFGFALRNADTKKYSSYNVGSPIYMPPEALNENKYSYKSDLWALGVIFYEMLTGKTPWRAKTEKELAKQLIAIPIKKLIPPSISQSSQAFLLKTLNVDINQRMSPEELLRFNFTSSCGTIGKQLCVTQNSIFNGRNNNIRRTQATLRGLDRHETSLNKNSINTPTNYKQMPLLNSTNDFKTTHNFNLLKTAATVTNRTEKYISAQMINNSESNTLKDINICQPKDATFYDKKLLSKQLLSQIHFCRFLYKLMIRMKEKLCRDSNQQLNNLKECMCAMIFQKLEQIKSLSSVSQKIGDDYRTTPDYQKISQIIEQYQTKYAKDLSLINSSAKVLHNFKQILTKSILSMYQIVNQDTQLVNCKEELVVLDYLVTLRQLVGLLQNNDLEGFHNKSKIEAIVEGAPSKVITIEHFSAICSKLKAIKII